MRNSTGFTLIEMLVVITIIGILASLILVGVINAIGSSKINSTKASLLQIKMALEQYKNYFGDYPPSSLTEFGATLPNNTNNGIEAMLACLSTNNGGPFYEAPSKFLANTDNDSVKKNITNWYFGDNQLREVIDDFGNPFIYFHFRDYQKPSKNIIKYIIGGQVQECRPSKDNKTGTFCNPYGFQLWSLGPDGKNDNGGGDDITCQ